MLPERVAERSATADHVEVTASAAAFIGVSRRMHPDVCRFVREISYGGELTSLEECARQGVTSDAANARCRR